MRSTSLRSPNPLSYWQSHSRTARDEVISRKRAVTRFLEVGPNVATATHVVAFLSREPSPDPRERQPGHPCLPILLDTFGSYVDDTTFLREVAPYFTQLPSTVGTTLWTQGDQANALYLIESGSLRATYSYDDHTNPVQETMVAGTIAGDLSLLSDTARNATVVVERDAVLWKLDRAALAALERELPEVARRFIQVVLKGGSNP